MESIWRESARLPQYPQLKGDISTDVLVIGGIGSITGSILASFLYIFSSEWLLRGLDSGTFFGINAPSIFKNGFRMVVLL